MANYKRVNKATARKMYNHGCSILLLPCKVRESAIYDSTSSNLWVRPCEINIIESSSFENKFDMAVNNFEYYNCNAELGYYAHYYVTIEDITKCKFVQEEEQ